MKFSSVSLLDLVTSLYVIGVITNYIKLVMTNPLAYFLRT